jgi:hypothetical protein
VTAIGANAGSKLTTAISCTFIGYASDFVSTTQYNESTAIGYNSLITGSNQVVLGTASETTIIPSKKIQYGGAYQPNSVFRTISATTNWNTTPPTILPHFILFSATGTATIILTLPLISNANIFEGMVFEFRRTNTTASSTTTSILSVASSGTDTIYGVGAMTTAAAVSVLGNGVYYSRLVCINKTATPYNWAYFP